MTHRHGEVVVGAAALILDEEFRVLLTQRSKDPRKGYWHLPGGGVEFGERWSETVVREIREELGVGIALVQEAPATVTEDIIPGEGRHVICAHFVAAIVDGEPQALDGTETWGWFSEADLHRLSPLLPSSVWALREVLGWDI